MPLAVIVAELDVENYETRHSRYEIGNPQRRIAEKHSLNEKTDTAKGEHREAGKRYAVGVTRPDSVNRLRQVAEYQA